MKRSTLEQFISSLPVTLCNVEIVANIGTGLGAQDRRESGPSQVHSASRSMDSILQHSGAAKALYDVVKVWAEIRHSRTKLFGGLAHAFREALADCRTSSDTCLKTDY